MDRFYGKRTTGGLCVPKKTSGVVLRDADNSSGDAQFCNRLGCSGRLKYTKATQVGNPRNSKSLRPSTHSASAKEIGGRISSSSSVVNKEKIKLPDSRRKLRSGLETKFSGSSSSHNKIDFQELSVTQRTDTRGFQSNLIEAESGILASVKLRSSNVISKARIQNSLCKRPGLTNVDALPSSSSSSSGSNDQGPNGFANASQHGLRSLHTSMSAAIRPGNSLSDSNIGKRRDIAKKKIPEREASSSGGGKNKISERPSDGGHISNPTNGFAFPEHRRNRNLPPRRENGMASVQSRRLNNSNTRTGHPSQMNGTTLSSAASSVFRRQIPRSERNIYTNANSLREESFSGGSHSNSANYDDHVTTMPSANLGIARLMNRDGSRQYNVDNIAEVLLALERIEQQDEELTYQHLLSLGTNLFFGGLSIYDQHRDMRLDIDDMSYEELLALEEKMGNVSTALSEDALLKSVTMSTYQPVSTNESINEAKATSTIKGEDMKCSICQEEYMTGEEVGKIGCEHGYHMECIKQWLQLKNWCPICKASVEPQETW